MTDDTTQMPTDEATPTKARRRPRGRPGRPRTADAARTVVVGVRMTPAERERIRAIAGDTGAGELMRSLALGGSPRIPKRVPELNRAAWEELARTASNLNQLAYRTNGGEVVGGDELADALSECRRLLIEVRRALLTGHGRPAEDRDGDEEVIDDGGR